MKADLAFHPKVNPNSTLLAQKKGRDQGTLHENLHREEAVLRAKHNFMEAEKFKEVEEACSFKP